MPVLIDRIEPDSPACQAGIVSGDTLLSINGNFIYDVLDYRFYMTNCVLTLALIRAGKPFSCCVEKGEYEDLGLEFETYLIDRQQSCKNKCIFCFIDQMPKGMRESLYFKDDDSRMSFLFGNYITLTNLRDSDIDRIIKMHISPVNVSVHTTDPELRVRMMKNPNAAASLDYLSRLTQAGIRVNTQLVLVPGYNDGKALEESLHTLAELGENLQSIACVPVGLTRHRKGLEELRCFHAEEARRTIEIIHAFASKQEGIRGERVAYPSDEFFLKADIPIPDSQYYGEFDQLENGVGLTALLRDDFAQALAADSSTDAQNSLTIATGVASYPLIRTLADHVMQKHPSVSIEVRAVINRFFGEEITVAGLITGRDLLEQLAGRNLGTHLLIPSVMLRREKDCFLDDVTLGQLSENLGVPVMPVENDGWLLYEAMTH